MERPTRSGSRLSPTGYLQENWFWWAVTLAALAPLAALAWNGWHGALGVDPVNTINNLSGRAALIVLFLSLACTPLNTIFGFRRALTVRKSLGLIAFAYASLHLLNFVTRAGMRRLGKNWKRLHRFVYVAGVLVGLHFLWQAKATERWEPLVYAAILALLLFVRIPAVRQWLVTQRKRLTGRATPAESRPLRAIKK